MPCPFGRFFFALYLIVAAPMLAGAQTPPVTLQRLASPVDTIRIHAFYALRASATPTGSGRESLLADRARHDRQLGGALIALLRRENQLMRTGASSASIGWDNLMDYWLDLSATVAAMRDPGAVDALIPWVSTGGVVRDALISFGEVSVPGLVTMLADPERTQRMAAASDLGQIARDTTRSLSASARAAIRAGLLRVLQDEPVMAVRLEAVGALASFSDNEIRQTMERLAVADTATCSFCRVQYPVREAAKAWLAKHPK